MVSSLDTERADTPNQPQKSDGIQRCIWIQRSCCGFCRELFPCRQALACSWVLGAGRPISPIEHLLAGCPEPMWFPRRCIYRSQFLHTSSRERWPSKHLEQRVCARVTSQARMRGDCDLADRKSPRLLQVLQVLHSISLTRRRAILRWLGGLPTSRSD